jgi:hypothetical protein
MIVVRIIFNLLSRRPIPLKWVLNRAQANVCEAHHVFHHVSKADVRRDSALLPFLATLLMWMPGRSQVKELA